MSQIWAKCINTTQMNEDPGSKRKVVHHDRHFKLLSSSLIAIYNTPVAPPPLQAVNQ